MWVLGRWHGGLAMVEMMMMVSVVVSNGEGRGGGYVEETKLLVGIGARVCWYAVALTGRGVVVEAFVGCKARGAWCWEREKNKGDVIVEIVMVGRWRGEREKLINIRGLGLVRFREKREKGNICIDLGLSCNGLARLIGLDEK